MAKEVEAAKSEAEQLSVNREERRNLYNRTVRRAELRAILLSSLDFKVDRDLQISEAPRPTYSGKIINFAFDNERGACVVRVEWKVELKIGRKHLSRCVARYDAVYDGFDCDESIAKIFADNVARSATYSYFRAMYASLDWSAELGSPPLPVIKFQPKV